MEPFLCVLSLSLSLSEVISGEAAEYTCSLQDLKVGYNRLVVKEHEFHNFIKTALVYATPTAPSYLVICALSLSLSLPLPLSLSVFNQLMLLVMASSLFLLPICGDQEV